MFGKPLPGDAVIAEVGTDVIPRGTIGVIEGILGKENERYTVNFGQGSIYRDNYYTIRPGGPAVVVSAGSLVSAYRSISLETWHWDGERRDRTVMTTVNARLFTVNLQEVSDEDSTPFQKTG